MMPSIGLDVHQATISAAILDATGKLLMECILETKPVTILEFIHGLRGGLRVTLEEGTCAAWLHDLLKPHVTRALVCEIAQRYLATSFDRCGQLRSVRLWPEWVFPRI